MTQDFDKLISDAAPVVPDNGASRRMTRALLHEKMRHQERRSRKQDLRGMSLAASLVFLIVIGGQVTQLGSDGFEVELVPWDIGNGEIIPRMVSPIRGNVGVSVPGLSDEGNRQLQEMYMLRSGSLEELSGRAFDQDTPVWNTVFVETIDGIEVRTAHDPINLSVTNGKPRRDKIQFMLNEYEGFLELVASWKIPAIPYGQISAEGMVFEVTSWTKTYPEWGTFTYYQGLPTKP